MRNRRAGSGHGVRRRGATARDAERSAFSDGTITEDPTQAFEAELAATLAGERRVQSLRSLFEWWAGRDPQAAAAAVESLSGYDEAGILREGLGGITGRHWAEQDPDAAIDWATRRGDLSLWGGVLLGIAASDPQRALTVASGVPARRREELANVVIAKIADEDPAAAARHWQDAGIELSAYTANRITRNWAVRDQAAAETWALGLSAGDGRDTALSTIVGLGNVDSAHAAELVNQIHADYLRAMAAYIWISSARERQDPALADFESRLVLAPASRAEIDRRLRR